MTSAKYLGLTANQLAKAASDLEAENDKLVNVLHEVEEDAVYAYHCLQQAIEATLGRGECHDKNGFDPDFGFECVECGTTVDAYMCSEYAGIQEQFRYCPGCGARVVTL